MKAEKLYLIISKWEEQWKKDCGGMLSSKGGGGNCQ